MAGGLVVTCPECKKKFKPKTDVQGKKIKCPFCTHPFVVPLAKADPSKPAQAKSGKGEAEAKTTAAAPADDPDENPDPYGVKTVELVPRCPNCTEEMGPHDIICLNCGYNTLMRTWGKTEKTVGVTFGRHLVYLLPALGAAVFVVITIIIELFYGTVYPYYIDHESWLTFSDSEALRMWSTVINLSWIWGAGVYCFKKFIEKPKPDELVLE